MRMSFVRDGPISLAMRTGSLGWGMNPTPLAKNDLEKGRLVTLDPDLPFDVPLYWQVARIMAPALAPLTAAIRAAARGALEPLP